MSQGKEQYLIEVWNKVLQYLYSNRNIEPQILDNFYSPCSLYELTDEKAILLVPNIVSKQIIQSQSDIISAAFIDVLQKDTPMIVEIYQKSDVPKIITPVVQYDETEFPSMPIQKERTFDNFVVGDCNSSVIADVVSEAEAHPLPLVIGLVSAAGVGSDPLHHDRFEF